MLEMAVDKKVAVSVYIGVVGNLENYWKFRKSGLKPSVFKLV